MKRLVSNHSINTQAARYHNLAGPLNRRLEQNSTDGKLKNLPVQQLCHLGIKELKLVGVLRPELQPQINSLRA